MCLCHAARICRALFAVERLSAYYPAITAELQSQIVDALARRALPLLTVQCCA